MSPASIAEQLRSTGLCICPDFVPPRELRELREDLESAQRAGELSRAAVGYGADQQVSDRVRRDDIRWLDRAEVNPVQLALWGKLDPLRTVFNQSLFLGVGDVEGHYASYPTGGFYRRHLDCFRQDRARVVSVVLYLNHNWLERDGGHLRVFDQAGSHVNILPVGGTLVCFMSGESEHEVLPGLRTRLSFAGWFRRTEQGPPVPVASRILIS